MPDTATLDLIVLPPVADDPIFAEDLFGETSSSDLEILTEVSAELPRRPGSDPHDFAALFMRHRWSFALHARRFLRDERDVDEVVQEGFLKLFLAMPELETELQALAYCRRTITNLCIDRYRADQRRPRLIDLETIPVDILYDDDEVEVDPVVQAEDAAVVRQALAMLSPIHREALIKREVEEKSLPQVAAELDITVEQAKHLLFRARRSLRRLLVGTQVQPGVDLDLAIVLAANKARAVRVAKPTGAAALAVLLVLAAVLGVRSVGVRPSTVADLPAGGSMRPLLGELQAPHSATNKAPRGVTAQVPAAASHPAVPRGASTATVPARLRSSSGPRTSSHPVPSLPKPVFVKPPVEGTPGSSTGGAPPPVVVPPVSPPVVVGPQAYSVAGLLRSMTVPGISAPESFVAPSGSETSLHRFEAGTADGPLRLVQTITQFPDGGLTFAVEPSLPVEGSAVTVDLSQAVTTVDRRVDGTVAVRLVGSFALGDAGMPQAPPPGKVAPAWPTPLEQQLRVELLYSDDLSSVVAEHVTVGAPNDAFTPLPPTKSGLPDSAPAPDLPSAPAVTNGSTTGAPDTSEYSVVDGRDQTASPSS